MIEEFIITQHAEERLIERFGCKKYKIEKIVIKAWNSNEKMKSKYISKFNQKVFLKFYRNQRYIKMRLYQGYLFIFRLNWDTPDRSVQKYLITIYK